MDGWTIDLMTGEMDWFYRNIIFSDDNENNSVQLYFLK